MNDNKLKNKPVPYNYARCFNEHCPKAPDCLRHVGHVDDEAVGFADDRGGLDFDALQRNFGRVQHDASQIGVVRDRYAPLFFLVTEQSDLHPVVSVRDPHGESARAIGQGSIDRRRVRFGKERDGGESDGGALSGTGLSGTGRCVGLSRQGNGRKQQNDSR